MVSIRTSFGSSHRGSVRSGESTVGPMVGQAEGGSEDWSFSFMRWDTPGHVVWNVLANVLFFTAVVGILHPRSRPLRQGWPSKVCWFLGVGVSFFVAGVYVPVGAVAVLVQLRRGWNEHDARRTHDHAAA